jgi:hypothetical protein
MRAVWQIGHDAGVSPLTRDAVAVVIILVRLEGAGKFLGRAPGLQPEVDAAELHARSIAHGWERPSRIGKRNPLCPTTDIE